MSFKYKFHVNPVETFCNIDKKDFWFNFKNI